METHQELLPGGRIPSCLQQRSGSKGPTVFRGQGRQNFAIRAGLPRPTLHRLRDRRGNGTTEQKRLARLVEPFQSVRRGLRFDLKQHHAARAVFEYEVRSLLSCLWGAGQSSPKSIYQLRRQFLRDIRVGELLLKCWLEVFKSDRHEACSLSAWISLCSIRRALPIV